MKGIRLFVGGGLLVALIAGPRIAHAAPIKAEQDALRGAYLDLVTGDHDYKGHRVKALKQVEAARKLIGLNVSGDGKAKQAQLKSDGALHDAEKLLEGVRDAANANGQSELLKHVNEAIEQIDAALKIKQAFVSEPVAVPPLEKCNLSCDR